jgi:ketosteroid isomerase-like protein
MSRQNLEIVQGIYDAWQRRDFKTALAPFDEEVEWIGPPDISRDELGHAFGVEGMVRSLEHWLENWEDYRYELRELIDHDDQVLSAGWQRGRGRESGVVVSEEIYSVWTLRAGKVVKQRMFRDRAEALEAAGLSK